MGSSIQNIPGKRLSFPWKRFHTKEHLYLLDVSLNSFVEQLTQTVNNPKADTSKILEQLKPFILKWKLRLTQPLIYLDIEIISLLQLLHKDPNLALRSLKKWVSTFDDIESELLLILFLFLRSNFKIHPKRLYKNIYPAFAYNFKLFLKNYIVTNLRHLKSFPINESNNLYLIDKHEDFLLLKNLKKQKWNYYLFYLSKLGLSERDLAPILHASRKTFSKEYQQCQLYQI